MTNASNNPEYWYKLNIKDEYMDDFGIYLAEIVKRTKEIHGVEFSYICPLNEPEWEADGMETCHANNAEVAKVAKAVSKAFSDYNLSTKVVIPESGKPQFVYYYEPYLAPDRVDPKAYGWKAKNFFSREGDPDCYLGDVDNVAKLLASHSYWSVDTDNELRQIRTKVGEEINKYGIKYWETEFCILSNDYDLGTLPDGTPMGGGGRDYSMTLALYVARIIHADLCYANASAWHWWIGATPNDYKDGLIYLIGNTQDGEVNESKLLWTMGNFSRFIRPKAHRIRIASEEGDTDNLHGMLTSAFLNADGKVVVVMINYTDKKQAVNLNGSDNKKRSYIPFITSDREGDDLRPDHAISDAEGYELPPRSVVTFCEI
jgi:O-glycosyl hydrolase